jgi:iron complex outermembrane recepter protein
MAKRERGETMKYRLILGSSVLAVALANPAMAQDAGAGNESVENGSTIVVTAQFREQDLQRTPLAITAVNSEMLEARGIENVLDVAQTAPNVTLAPAQSNYGKALTAYIRGVGQFDFNPALEPGVGVYIDDVYYSTVYGAAFDLVDLDRIEVLRGPQGTLSGRNSIGGSVKLYSNRPNGQHEGSVGLSYGSNNALELRGSGDFTLVPEKVFVGVSGLARSGGGYIDRLDYGCLFPSSGWASVGGNPEEGCKLGELGDENITAGRVFVRALPSEDLEISLIADVTVDSGLGQAASFRGLI